MVGYARSTADQPFIGTLNYWLADTSYHLSFARQARDGHFLLGATNLGADVGRESVVNLLFLTIGLLSRWLGLPLAVAFNVVRIMSGVAVLLLAYRLAGHLLRGPFWRGLFLVLVSSSSGFGWLTMLGWAKGHRSCDLWLIEVNTFWSLRWEVVVPPVVALLLLGFDATLRFLDTGRQRHAAVAGTAALLLAAVHPHDVLTLFIVAGATALFRFSISAGRRPSGASLVAGLAWLVLLPLPLLLWHLRAVVLEPAYAEYLRIVDPVGLASLVSGFGLVGLLGAAGGVLSLVRREPGGDLCALWVAVAFALTYVPVPPFGQVFLMHGVHIALCLLGVRLLELLAEGRGTARLRAWRIVGIAVALVSVPSNALHYANELELLRGSARVPFPHRDLSDALEFFSCDTLGRCGTGLASPYYLSRGVAAAMSWLATEATPSDVVLARPGLGVLVPFLTPARVWLPLEDHPRYPERQAAVERFFDPVDRLSPAGREAFLRRHGIRYVILGPDVTSAARERLCQELKLVGAQVGFDAEGLTILGLPDYR